MRRKTTRKSSAATRLVSPPPPPSATAVGTRSPTPSPPPESPAIQFDFNLKGFTDIASSLKKTSNKKGSGGASSSKRMKPTGLSPQRSLKSMSTISDLKEMASSNLNSLKNQLDRSHSEILKDFDSSKCRLQKRYKIQTQACEQVMDEAEKEHKRISDQINEATEAMQASYSEFIAEAQASASRLCKTTIPELTKKSEKAIASLKSRYGLSSTPV